jgi:hypothetical protein
VRGGDAVIGCIELCQAIAKWPLSTTNGAGCATLQRILGELIAMREDMKVLTAIMRRHEETLIRMLEQMQAMIAQNSRILDRPRGIDDNHDAWRELTPPIARQ